MKKISLKGLADFMSASSTRQRSIIRDYKYPSDDEAKAKIHYYRDARDVITAYHSSDHDAAWLVDEARRLESLAELSGGRRKTRLNHNGRALRSYAKHYADREYEVLGDFGTHLQFGDVFVSVYPDLHVMDRGKEKFIKFEFAINEPSDLAVKIISQALLAAAEEEGLGLSSSCVLYYDVPRGKDHRGARMGSRMNRDIESACMTISAIWDTI